MAGVLRAAFPTCVRDEVLSSVPPNRPALISTGFFFLFFFSLVVVFLFLFLLFLLFLWFLFMCAFRVADEVTTWYFLLVWPFVRDCWFGFITFFFF